MNSLSGKNRKNSRKQNLDIPQKGNVINIINITGKLFTPGDSIAAADLCQTGQARSNIVAAALFFGIKGEVLHKQGAGAYQ